MQQHVVSSHAVAAVHDPSHLPAKNARNHVTTQQKETRVGEKTCSEPAIDGFGAGEGQSSSLHDCVVAGDLACDICCIGRHSRVVSNATEACGQLGSTWDPQRHLCWSDRRRSAIVPQRRKSRNKYSSPFPRPIVRRLACTLQHKPLLKCPIPIAVRGDICTAAILNARARARRCGSRVTTGAPLLATMYEQVVGRPAKNHLYHVRDCSCYLTVPEMTLQHEAEFVA